MTLIQVENLFQNSFSLYLLFICRVRHSFSRILTIGKKYLFIAILPALLFQSGCETSDIDPDFDGMGYGFYPLYTGLYRDYKIHYIKYSVLNEPDTSDFFLREIVIDSVSNAEDGYTYILARYNKDSLDHDWSLDSLWKAEKNSKSRKYF